MQVKLTLAAAVELILTETVTQMAYIKHMHAHIKLIGSDRQQCINNIKQPHKEKFYKHSDFLSCVTWDLSP